MIKIGIDPGNVSGSVVIKAQGLTNGWHMLPFRTTDYYTIDNMLKSAKTASTRNGETIKAILEKVHTMPKQGISSAGKFMENYGTIKGLLIANAIPFREVPPQTWMKMLPIKKDKSDTREMWKKKLMQLAKQLQPDLKITHETADAVLMVEYLDRIYI